MNESKYTDWSDEELRRLSMEQYNAQYLKRDLFARIIATNDKELIKRTADYIYSKAVGLFFPCQFLFRRLYEIEHAQVELVVGKLSFDFSEFDESISLSNKIESEMNARISFLKNKKNV